MEIIGFDNYKIYENGNGKILKPRLYTNGYYNVILYKDGKPKKRYIHRLIALHFIDNPENHPCVDHIDRDTKNNQIGNLRWVTRSQNNRNKTKVKNTSSKYYGVCWKKKANKYEVRIKIDKKRIHLGYFVNEEDGAKRYNKYLEDQNLEFFNKNIIDLIF